MIHLTMKNTCISNEYSCMSTIVQKFYDYSDDGYPYKYPSDQSDHGNYYLSQKQITHLV